jgi:hypothetical protein
MAVEPFNVSLFKAHMKKAADTNVAGPIPTKLWITMLQQH